MYGVVEICLLLSVDVQQWSHSRGTRNSQTSPSPAFWNSCGSEADFQLSKRQRDGFFPRSKPWGVLKCDPARRSWTCGCRLHTARDGVCEYGDGHQWHQQEPVLSHLPCSRQVILGFKKQFRKGKLLLSFVHLGFTWDKLLWLSIPPLNLAWNTEICLCSVWDELDSCLEMRRWGS